MNHVVEAGIVAVLSLIVSGFFWLVVGGTVGFILASAVPYFLCLGLPHYFDKRRERATMSDTSD